MFSNMRTIDENMKVFIVTKEAIPNGMAATNRIKCYARAIHEGGVECEVIVCGCTELNPQNVRNTEAEGLYEGVPFRYIGGSTMDFHPTYIRLAGQVLRLWKTEQYLRRNMKKGDVLFLFLGGKVKRMLRFMKIAKSNGAYCVRDLCELPYGTGAETEQALRLRKITLEKQFPRLDGIVSISDALLNLAKEYTLPSCKHIKVPIMVEYEHYGIAEKPAAPEVPFIFHAGTLLQQKDGILGMVEAFGMAKQRLQKPIKYILTGNINSSSHPEELRRLIDKYHIADSLEFVGYLNRDQIKKYLTHASLVISNRPKSQQDYYGFSTKVGEYLASGTPLIMTNWGEAVNWLEDGKSAIFTEPEDTVALADAIVRVFANPDESRRIGLAGQEVCRNSFDYHNWSKPLVEFLNQLG